MEECPMDVWLQHCMMGVWQGLPYLMKVFHSLQTYTEIPCSKQQAHWDPSLYKEITRALWEWKGLKFLIIEEKTQVSPL